MRTGCRAGTMILSQVQHLVEAHSWRNLIRMRSQIGWVASLLLLGWFNSAPVAVAQRPGSPGRTVYADSCLPTSEFQLHGIAVDADERSALEHLGKWVSVAIDTGEYDGGRYYRRTYYYRDLEVDVVRGVVDRLATRSPRAATPSGLRPGLGRDAVHRLLLTKGVTFKHSGDALEIPPCLPPVGSTALEDLITLSFDRTGRVRAIEISGSRP